MYWRTELTKVEIFKDNEWIIYSWHKNSENGIINAEVVHKSRKLDTRVTEDGKIIWAKEGGNKDA